jgi:transcriptional regulator GlxA family with amidase domain
MRRTLNPIGQDPTGTTASADRISSTDRTSVLDSSPVDGDPLIGSDAHLDETLRALGADASEAARPEGFVAGLCRMLRNPFRPHTVATLAEAARMNPGAFRREFVRRLGAEPEVYLERERLRAAERALRTGPLSIAAIATRHGFESRTELTRAFMQRYGRTPSEARGKPSRRGE